MFSQQFCQNADGTLGQSALSLHQHISAQCRRHWQQKTQGRTAFSAIHHSQFFFFLHWEHFDFISLPEKICPQGLQTLKGGFQILGAAVKHHFCWLICQRRANEQSMSIGLGGNHLHRPPQSSSGYFDVHSLPPLRFHSCSG